MTLYLENTSEKKSIAGRRKKNQFPAFSNASREGSIRKSSMKGLISAPTSFPDAA